MHRARFLLWFRSLLAAFIAVSLIATPAAAAAETPHEHAEFASVHGEMDAADLHAHDEDHDGACLHQHGCGSCHFHWMGTDATLALPVLAVAPGGAEISTETLVYLAKAGPYRPPRA